MRIFITYADKKFKQSEKRILNEAKATGLFDKLIGYSPEDLPPYILSSPLMAYTRGGGYWCWKPWIIWKTLQDYPESIVVYADAGCSLNQSNEWYEYFKLMEYYDTIVTQYRSDIDYGWSALYPGKDVQPRIINWTKQDTVVFFNNYFNGDTSWQEYNKVWAGFIISKRGSKVIQDWLNLTLFYPRLISDPNNIEESLQHPNYVAHRHDQSILTPIVYMYSTQSDSSVAVIPETGETNYDSGVVASRIVNSSTYRLTHYLVKIASLLKLTKNNNPKH